MTRGLRIGCSVCHDTTISNEASAPNCRCSPATGGVVSGSAAEAGAGAASAPPAPISDAASAALPASPAAVSSLRRLSSRSNSLSGFVMSSGPPKLR
jgi:hypothetical protein